MNDNYYLDITDKHRLKQRELSDWVCYLFGGGDEGIVYLPCKENVPNFMVRFFMKVCLGCRWVKKEE